MPWVCSHLNRDADSAYARYFSGVGIEHALICLACRDDPGAIKANLEAVSPERFAEIEREGRWDSARNAIIGRPEILERASGLSFQHREVALEGEIPSEIADLRPITSSESGGCLALAEDGALFRIDPERGAIHRLMSRSDFGAVLEPKWSLHVSPDGEMAVVVEVRGDSGVVLDLAASRPTMRLDRGDYHSEHSDFPVAFFEADGQLRLVHGTDWNRLDISDPRSGELLTDRSPTSYHRGEERPEHYLNYFHGGLVASPGGDRILDNGWIWAPIGVVMSWSLRRWLAGNPWESEDGQSKRGLCSRYYYWDGPLCWVDDRTAAVWGYGNDDDNLIPAVQLFDVEDGTRIRWFAGPAGTLACDRYLFSFAAEGGTSVWDVLTGERLLHDGSFCPAAYHPGARQFVTLLPGGRLRMSRLAEG